MGGVSRLWDGGGGGRPTEEGSVARGSWKRRGLWRCEGARERGAGAVWVLAFMAVVWLVGAAVVVGGGVRIARQRGEVAADLAALAGAARVGEGERSACRVAGRIANGSGGRLAVCSVRGAIVEVEVVVGVRVPVGGGGLRIVSRARAGPVGP
ncbi:Rv3654c family TadE-like protein [Actinomadura namibiensis]|uniref:Rv3654c family TadE-like protein n=1 Tax=Actinomadura kijaniata TaxID=46161 RepID=UPI0016037D98|nr:Rv3654c family TadE-like protein [Actinomadura namibiensis]